MAPTAQPAHVAVWDPPTLTLFTSDSEERKILRDEGIEMGGEREERGVSGGGGAWREEIWKKKKKKKENEEKVKKQEEEKIRKKEEDR